MKTQTIQKTGLDKVAAQTFGINQVRSVGNKILSSAVIQQSLLAYGKWRHRHIAHSVARDQHHHYTCFHRSPLQLEALTGPVLEFLNRHMPDKPLKIIVFGCSTGAEPYTIASILMQRMPDLNFRILASDIDAKVIEKAAAAQYKESEVLRRNKGGEAFINFTFTFEDGTYTVKPSIRSRVSFHQADVVESDLVAVTGLADIVFAQNIFFHVDPGAAPKAFHNVCRTLKPRSALFVDGMELGMRESLSQSMGLSPLNYKVRDIHEEARSHTQALWWRVYWGCEPYSRFASNSLRRYATIFLKGTGGPA